MVTRRKIYEGTCSSEILCNSLTFKNLAIQKNSNNTLIVVITDRRPQLISSIH
jgi:hypothetical protein